MEKRDVGVLVTDEVAELLKNSTHLSSVSGKAHHLLRIKASRKRTRNEIVEAKAKLAAEDESLQEIKKQNSLLKDKNIESERIASHTKGILD